MTHNSKRGFVVYFVVLILAYSLAGVTSTLGQVSANAIFRQVYWPDRGSIHIFLSNDGPEQVKLLKLAVGNQTFEPSESGFVAQADMAELMGNIAGLPVQQNKRLPLILRDYLPQNTKPGDVLWYWAPTYTLAAEESTELVIKFSNTPKKAIPIRLSWSNQEVIEMRVTPVPTKLELSAINFEPAYNRLYAYVCNDTDKTIELCDIWINGKRQDKHRVSIIGKKVSAKATGLAVVRLIKPMVQGQWCNVLIETANSQVMFGSARALTGFPVANLRSGIIKPDETYLSWDGVKLKTYGDINDERLDAIAERMIRNRTDPGFCARDEYFSFLVSQPFIKFCATACGELTDCASLHLQPSGVSYLGRYNDTDFHYVQAKARYLRKCFAPRPIFGHTEVGHAHMSTAYKGLLCPEEFRLRCYYMLSRGIKGILYSCGGEKLAEKCTMSERRNLEREINTLGKEFVKLRPYLRIAEAVEGLALCSEPLVEPATLLAGDKGMIVILLNHDRQQSWPQNEMFLKDSFFLEPVRWPFSVNVKLPKSLPIVDVLEISGNQCLSIPFKQIENLITFDVPSLRATRQYILRSDKQSPYNKTDSLEYTISRHDCPKATFLEKQVFLGRVNPSPDGYQAVFFCRNDGNRLLHVEYVNDENTDVSLTPAQVVIKPNDTASLIAHCTADSNPTLHEVIHVKTNDLKRPLIRLDIGAEIVPDVEISPQTLTLDSTKGKMRRGSFVLSDNTGGGLEIKKIWSPDQD